MQMLDGILIHAASDLNAFSECRHLTTLDIAAASGELARPERDDATAALLARKGEEHEQRYLERMRERFGERLVAFTERPAPTRAAYLAAEREAVAAMASGAQIIYQPTFFDGTFLGRADFLRRVERPSARWPWSYEVLDTKLALSPKPYFLVQLGNYSEHLERIQGSTPEEAAIILGTGEERRFRVADYAAYYRRLKKTYLENAAAAADTYPFECAHCDLCVWRDACETRRDRDDHLSLVAGMRRDQIRKLEDRGVTTVTALATASVQERPKGMAPDTFATLRAQAAEQHRYREAKARDGWAEHSYRLRDTAPECGLGRLPAPDAGDIFFDIEGDPLYRPDRSLEYLFGIYLPAENAYIPFWGRDPAEERLAFIAFVDFVVARRKQYPSLHVYHYASYETTALKRLMGRFGTREREIDEFLRAGTFVDLFPIVRQSVFISQDSYSIKKVEALYGIKRTTQTKGGDDSIVMFESWLESGDDATLEDIRAYNEDDCRSTHALRDWLLTLRDERSAMLGESIPWHVSSAVPPPDESERLELEERLLAGIARPDSLPALRAMRDDDRARWLLGNLLQYHRREQKPEWWEYFHRLEPTTNLVEDAKALGGLELRTDVKPWKLRPNDTTVVYTYTYPEQDHDLGSKPIDPSTGKGAGTIVSMDDVTRTLQIKLANAVVPESLSALVPEKPRDQRHRREALERAARAYLEGSLAAQHPAVLTMLLAQAPRLLDQPAGAPVQPAIVTKSTVSRLIAALDRTALVIQGPPGSGKSTTGASAIVDALAAGKRVALAAQSHKALHNLVGKVEECASARNVAFNGAHKCTEGDDDSLYRSSLETPLVRSQAKWPEVCGAQLVSATTYAWCMKGADSEFDLLVIDEAGQIALADALITSLVARNVVLLGDPQQLAQVSKGFHPIGADLSVLEHMLGERATVPIERGVFLDTSYRMHPEIDTFVSRSFYDGRLHADPANSANRIVAGGEVRRSVEYQPVVHEGNGKKSPEEAAAVVALVEALVAGATVSLRGGQPRPLREDDILVVVPYNAHRLEVLESLKHRGLRNVAVGTVDKFQGQEAPLVLYSMATSSIELAPRGLDFLLSPNRFNVAVSRAQAVSIVVSSPSLLTARATTIEAMRLLNLVCAYVEAAERGARTAERAAAPENGTQLALELPLAG